MRRGVSRVPFPKMLPTKSRLETRLPGAKKRTSMDFSGEYPGTPGVTTGRSRRETKTFAGVSPVPVKCRVMIPPGGRESMREIPWRPVINAPAGRRCWLSGKPR